MKKDRSWKWKAHAVREAPKKDAPTLVLESVGSDCNGNTLWSLSDKDGVAPTMTAAEWRNFALSLIRDSPVKE